MSKSGRRGEISRRRISGDAFHVFSLNYGLLKMLRTRSILRRFYAFRFQLSPSWAPYRNPPRSCKQKFARYGCGAHVFLSPAFGPNSALFGNLPSAISKPLPAKFGMGSFISCENFRFCAVVFCVLGDSDFLKFLYASSGKFRPVSFCPLKIPLNCERGGQTRRARRVPAKCALVRLKSSFATIGVFFFADGFAFVCGGRKALARYGFAGNLCAPKETFFRGRKIKNLFSIHNKKS